ncbi:MAG: hypothetical protein H6711_27185 [Myxococcales bacterium]|nr:hypothetical protein [Myxococcales bacterium]
MTKTFLPTAILAAATLVLAACPPATEGTVTDTAGTDTDDTTSTSGPSTTTVSTTTTSPTTTATTGMETDTGTTTTDSGSTSKADPVCGDGNVDAGEECDNGNDNADNAACTSACKNATCGDGLVFDGTETCDDGTNDGSYGGCMADCSAWGPRCGDGEVQLEEGEECDADDVLLGCLTTCKQAGSCLEIKTDNDAAANGVYLIQPEGFAELVEVFCDMDAGGYTYLKVSSQGDVNAMGAEAFCAGFSMTLLAPRTPEHVLSAFTAATTENVMPKGGGAVMADKNYISILGIYPVEAGMSCVGMPFNSTDCPEWQANDGGVFYISDSPISDQPATKNCAGCSMIYDWNDDGTVLDYAAFTIQGGGKSDLYMCTVNDLVP